MDLLIHFLDNNQNTMKLILDNNFVQETEKFTKEQDNAVKYKWFTAEWEAIELIDLEADKIKPIVRFLIEWKKNKISLFMIIWIGVLLFFTFILFYFLLFSGNTQTKTPELVATQNLTPINETENQTPIVEVTKTENINDDWVNETSWALELANEVDTQKDMKQEAELEAIRLNYENDRLQIELDEKQKEIEKLKMLVNKYEQDIELLNTRKTENATDEFIYYLWDSLYSKCQEPTTHEAIEKCKTLYFNFLEYGKNW